MTRKYDMSWRKLKQLASDAVKTKQAAERRSARITRSPKERRMERRLQLIPKDKRCPVCGVVRLKSRQWVLKKHRDYDAVCLACYRQWVLVSQSQETNDD